MRLELITSWRQLGTMWATKKFITSVYYHGLPSLSVSITLYLCFPCEIKKRGNNVDQRLNCIWVNPSISSSRFLIFPGDKSCLPTAVTNLLLEHWGQNAICCTTTLGNGDAPRQLEVHTASETKGHGWNMLLWAIYLFSFRAWVIPQTMHKEHLRQQFENSSGMTIIYA